MVVVVVVVVVWGGFNDDLVMIMLAMVLICDGSLSKEVEANGKKEKVSKGGRLAPPFESPQLSPSFRLF